MKILLSACLAGVKCRYDGSSQGIDLRAKYPKVEFVLVCPEVIGGLSTPRNPCEILNGRIVNNKAEDVTDAFYKGAHSAREIALKNNCAAAILKAKSPSCGSDFIYDGSFTGTLIVGDGIFVTLLKECNITVFSESNLADFEDWLSNHDIK